MDAIKLSESNKKIGIVAFVTVLLRNFKARENFQVFFLNISFVLKETINSLTVSADYNIVRHE